MKALKFFWIIILMINVNSSQVSANDADSSTPSATTMIHEWKKRIENEFSNRKTLNPATKTHIYYEISEFEETKRLVKLFHHNPDIEKELLAIIVRRSKESDWNESYADYYCTFLFCEAKDISVHALFKLTGSSYGGEMVFDHIVAALFANGELDSSKWGRSFKNNIREKKPNDYDKFLKPKAAKPDAKGDAKEDKR